MAHTIRCSHEWCDEYSLRVSFQAPDRETEAAEHVRSLIKDGWVDVEARLYCPGRKPVGE